MAELPEAILSKLSQIESKLNSSHVLNGGFEKLVQDVQHTNEQIGEVKESLETMNNTINDPESGVRSRVRDLEAESQRRWEFVQEAKKKIDDVEELQIWKKEVEDKVKTIDLHNLELDRLKIWQSNLSKLQWLFGSTLAILIIQALFGVLLP
jgi:methyl-accepting chemotaxis protein